MIFYFAKLKGIPLNKDYNLFSKELSSMEVQVKTVLNSLSEKEKESAYFEVFILQPELVKQYTLAPDGILKKFADYEGYICFHDHRFEGQTYKGLNEVKLSHNGHCPICGSTLRGLVNV